MITKHRLLAHAALVAAAALATSTFAADGAQPANYIGLHAGVNNLHEWDGIVDFGGGVTLPGQASLKRGTQFGVLGGRQTEHARFEAEWQHGSFDITSIHLGPVSQAMATSGHYDALTANAYRTQPVGDRFTAYGAVGIGWGRVSLPQMGFASGCNCFAASSKSGVTWLARAGLDYNLGREDKLFLQYTLLALPRPGSGSSPGVEYQRKKVGAVAVGYRHAF